MKKKLYLVIFCVLSLNAWPAQGYEIGLNIHGLSYHPDRTDSNGNRFKGFNPGIGARLVLSESKRHVWLTEGGVYSNSSGHASKYLAGGYRFKLPAGFQLGPSVALYQSPDQNSAKAFIVPLLVLSFRYQRVVFHAVPVPRYKDVNRNAAIGFYVTLNLWKKL